MKIFRILFLTSALAMLASCGPVKPESNDGHQLWFYSMDSDGMNLSPVKTTMAIAENEISQYWKGSEVSFDVLQTKDESLGSEGYRLVFNTGDNGGQTVHHIHFHFMGGRQFTWPAG